MSYCSFLFTIAYKYKHGISGVVTTILKVKATLVPHLRLPFCVDFFLGNLPGEVVQHCRASRPKQSDMILLINWFKDLRRYFSELLFF